MFNIHDYIRWRGDLPISSEHPFNEIDNLILARLSYMIFEKISMGKLETIASLNLKLGELLNCVISECKLL